MTKRESIVRYLNILIVLTYMIFYIQEKVFSSPGLYISATYIIYLILKPYMLRQPLTSPANFMFEFVDELFVLAISLFVTPNALVPLSMFMLIRCALIYPIFSVLLIYVMIMLFYMLTGTVNEAIEMHTTGLQMVMLVIPSCIICFIKNDVIFVDSKNRDLNEKVRIKSAVITELQKYSDVLFVGDNRKEDDMLRTDYVTQIPNRYHFEEMLRQGVKKAHEPSFNMGLLMIYIDNLYGYRVKYGYSTEHILIKRLHDLISEQVKSNDFIARYEEDCIAVLLFNKDLSNADDLAKIIYSNFETMKYTEPELKDLSLRIIINDIDSSMNEDGTSVDVMKLLNKGSLVEFFVSGSINQ